MNISLNNSDALSGILKIGVEKNDYEGRVEKNLREIRQKANMPGFRKGMVPMGMVKKMYGIQVLAEELNKIVAKALTDYIQENKVNILGEPIPNETEQKKQDLENDENFEFVFDLAYPPEFDIKLSKKDKLIYYKIKVDDEIIDKKIDLYTTSYGAYEYAETSEESDLLKGLLVELADGEPNPDGIMIEDAVIMAKHIKGKTEQKKFIGAGKGKKIIFNPFKAYKGSDTEMASLLNIDRAMTKEMKSDFSFEVKEIMRNKKAELNPELFDKIFEEGTVKDETEFREKIKDFLLEEYAPESDYRFAEDFHDLLLKKMESVTFADELLKRWLLIKNDGKTKEDIENEYPSIVKQIKYQLAREKLVSALGITVVDKDVEKIAEHAIKAQFAAQYGILSVPENLLDHHVKKMLEKGDTVRMLIDKAIEGKLAEAAKEKISIEEKEVTSAEFFNVKETKNNTKTKESETKD
jgi:trigger factor